MQIWATGIVCLYVGITLLNWVTGLHWLAEFSLPMAIVGGVGLAIASHPTQSAPSTLDTAKDPIEATAAAQEPQPEDDQPYPQSAKPATESSISFTINKNVRPG